MRHDEHPDPHGREAALRASQHASAAAVSAGQAASAAAEALGAVAHLAAERSRVTLSAASETARTAAREHRDLLPVPLVLEGVVEEARDRGADVWDALRGRPGGRSRRWPWATRTAVAGALLGVAAAVTAKRLGWRDAPGAQEPEEVRAVVDPAPLGTPVPPAAAGAPDTAGAPAGPVDEDGEAVPPVS